MNIHIQNYYKSVCEAYALGNIESSYYKPIAILFDTFNCNVRDLSGGRKGQSGENLDLKIWRSGDEITETEPFAAIEAKPVDGIDEAAKAKIKISIARYGNVILTDNLNWYFWQAGSEDIHANITLIERKGDEFVLIEDNIEQFIAIIEDFVLMPPAQLRSSGKLAEYMAKYAKTIRTTIKMILKDDGTGQPLVNDRQKKRPKFEALLGLYKKIREDLRPLLTTSSFADMYAQTIVYGLFIARYNDAANATYDKFKAIGQLQQETPLLNMFFAHIANSRETHPTLEVTIDKLCALYQTCDISALLDQDASRDTIVHFYENFLTHYDPVLRKEMGVFYTPNQVVRYLVSMVDRLLIEDFGIEGGLSNNDQIQATVPCEPYQVGKSKKWLDTKEITVPRVAVLDPACGTGTFHAEIIKYIKSTYFSGMREAFYSDYVQNENSLLSRLIGFEIMMTSYVVAHLNVRRTIAETLGTVPKFQLPTRIYMTNTLAKPNSEFEKDEQISLFDFSAAITDEAYKADSWKVRRPIKVIVGNPPYLAASTNPFDISAYKTETDGITDFGERKHLLNDDYVKFFHFSEQIINRNNEGILAFVSNNGFLDNPTFRGMRASLLRTFDKIFIVNLHGSAIKKEVAPDGSKDENIFDIMQGISLFVGIKVTSDTSWANVYYCDLWGSREHKFSMLANENVIFNQHTPDAKTALLIPIQEQGKNEYEAGISMAELFIKSNSGLITRKDNLCIQNSRSAIESVINDFINYEEEVLRDKYSLGADTTNWKVANAKNDISTMDGTITKILFRPFDERWTFFTGRSSGFMSRPCGDTMKNFTHSSTSPIGNNIGIVFARGDSTPNSFSMIFISELIVDNRITAAQTAGNASVAPLYISPTDLEYEWTPNFNIEQLQKLTQNLEQMPSPIEIFDYCYGVLYDPVYREKYNEFLKRDFPRVPIIENEEKFRSYVAAGERLRMLHLMQVKVPASLTLEPNTSDDLEIGAVKYKDGVLHLNANKRILGISDDVWNYRIGGYQVIDKWLKSHKGKIMTVYDFDHIANIVGLLAETIRIQESLLKLHE